MKVSPSHERILYLIPKFDTIHYKAIAPVYVMISEPSLQLLSDNASKIGLWIIQAPSVFQGIQETNHSIAVTNEKAQVGNLLTPLS